jgi:hypothetical protein
LEGKSEIGRDGAGDLNCSQIGARLVESERGLCLLNLSVLTVSTKRGWTNLMREERGLA